MARRVVEPNAVKRSAAKSAQVSAKLERRVVPDDFVRSATSDQYVTAKTRRPA